MNILEAEWLGRRLASVANSDLFPLLNVGSSTEDLRTRQQPHIDAQIFAPLRSRGGRVHHLDMKAAPGVDIVGDLLDAAFLEKVSRLQVRSVLVSNLFEHVTERRRICEVVMDLLPPGGYLFVSGPRDYPYHADPIDTMFRPSIAEMHAHFPGTTLIDSAILDSGNWLQWNASERGRPLSRFLLRLMLPFYRPGRWARLLPEVPYLFKHITAFAIVMRKDAGSGATAPRVAPADSHVIEARRS